MKSVLKEFLELFGNSLLVISLMLSSFLLLINLYHYREVNSAYSFDVANNEQYQSFKTTVDNIDTNIGKANPDTVRDSGKRMMLKVTEGQLKKCVAMVKASDFYKLNTTNFYEKDLYFLNDSLLTDIQNQCLFLVNYNINNSMKEYSVDGSNYRDTNIYVENQLDQVKKYSDFLKNEMLQNSSYGYATETTKTTIFNEMSYTTELIIFNYNNLIKAVDMMAEWYVVEAGGHYE